MTGSPVLFDRTKKRSRKGRISKRKIRRYPNRGLTLFALLNHPYPSDEQRKAQGKDELAREIFITGQCLSRRLIGWKYTRARCSQFILGATAQTRNRQWQWLFNTGAYKDSEYPCVSGRYERSWWFSFSGSIAFSGSSGIWNLQYWQSY